MSTIVDKAINMAVQNLNAAGCRYVIIKPNGDVLGEVEMLAPPKAERAHHKKIFKFAHLGYKGTLSAMKIGDVHAFTPDEGVPLEAYRKVLSATAAKLFGKGNYITDVRDTCIEVMRTGAEDAS